MPQKKRFGLKRTRQTIATPSPRKKPRISPRKSRDEAHVDRRQPRRENGRSHRKEEEVSNREVRPVREDKSPVEKERRGQERIPVIVERERRDLSASEKENSPTKDTVGRVTRTSGNSVRIESSVAPSPPSTIDASPSIAAPSLPVLEIPTLFSTRMYRRLYGKDPTTDGSNPPRKTMQPSVVDNTLKSQSDRSFFRKAGSSNQPSAGRINLATAQEEIRKFIEMNEISDSSCSNSSLLQFKTKPVATSFVMPQNCNGSVPVSAAQTQPKPHENTGVPPKIDVPDIPQTAVGPPTLSTSPKLSSPAIDQARAKAVAKGGLLVVDKTRQQTVAAIRPMQTTIQETPKPDDKSNINNGVSREPHFSIENSPDPPTEVNSSELGAEKSSHHLRIPGLSGSARGRTVRRVFAPISNQWNHSTPTDCSKHETHKKDDSEISQVKKVSVTSELSVRVDDLKEDEMKRQLFGSPVKWADDSSDSPKTEKTNHSRKMYSIFGSPCIDRSSSSEHPFAVPPGAYEDSCWTTQVSEKLPSTLPRETDRQKQKGKSTESCQIKPEEKAPKSNDAAKVSAVSSICPPPSLLKKHTSIFSPSKDSKHSVANRISDEPSRSNTGICFPFTRPRYEDSVLGQFDDTAQFVSALAKVDTKLSPLNTPIKCGDGRDTQVDTGKENLTSFQEVFKKNVPDELQNREFPQFVNGADSVIAEEPANPTVSNEEHDAGIAQSQSRLSTNPTTTNREENSQSRKTFEPPTITVTPPKAESSLRIIHRPNFASSTILSVKSWFPNAPVKMVTPRKTPRLVSSTKHSVSPKGFEGAGARIAINDAFIIEQEERVRRWELDHLYENTVRSGSGSPSKSVNGSPNRKRIESPSKLSPSKRSPKKQSLCKRRGEPRNLAEHRRSADTPVSRTSSTDGSLVGRHALGSQYQSNSVGKDVISCKPLTEPEKSLADPTKKLLSILNGIVEKTKCYEQKVECSLSKADTPDATVACRPVDSCIVNVGGEHNAHIDRTSLEPSEPTLEDAVLSHGSKPNVKSTADCIAEESIESGINKQVLPVISPALSQFQPPSAPLLLHDESEPSGTVGANVGLMVDVPKTSNAPAAAAAAVVPLTSSDVAEAPKSLPSNLELPTVKIKKQRKSLIKSKPSASGMPVEPSNTAGAHTTTQSSECVSSTSRGNGKSLPDLKRGIRNRVSRIPSTPLNKSVAGLIKSSIMSVTTPKHSGPRTPSVQSTKKTNFKRSSALKPSSQEVAGTSLMNSIRSTFYQGSLASSAKTDRPRASPKIRSTYGKSSPNNNNVTHTPVEPSFPKKDAAAPSKISADPAARHNVAHSEVPSEMTTPRQWKLIEVEQSKPISLLKRFKGCVDDSKQLETPLAPKSDREVNQESGKHPPKPPVLKSCIRRTILLESPMKMSTPTKAKRRNIASVDSPMPDETRVAPESVDSSKTRTVEDGRTIPVEHNSPTEESSRKSRADYHHSSRVRSSSCNGSSRKSWYEKRDDSPTPRRRRKSHSAYNNSPERSPPRRKSKSSDKYRIRGSKEHDNVRPSGRKTPLVRKSSRSSDRRECRRSESSSSESEFKKSSGRKTPSGRKFSKSSEKKAKVESRQPERSSSESESPELCGRKTSSGQKPSKTGDRLSERGLGHSKCSSSESRRPETPSADSRRRSSKLSSESADANEKIPSKEPSIANPGVQSPSSRTAPVVESVPRTSIPTPKIAIRRNRTANFSVTSTTTPTAIVFSMGKRPVMFQPTP